MESLEAEDMLKGFNTASFSNYGKNHKQKLVKDLNKQMDRSLEKSGGVKIDYKDMGSFLGAK